MTQICERELIVVASRFAGNNQSRSRLKILPKIPIIR